MRDLSKVQSLSNGRGVLAIASLLSACTGQVLGPSEDKHAIQSSGGATSVTTPSKGGASSTGGESANGSGNAAGESDAGRGGSSSSSAGSSGPSGTSGEGGDANEPAVVDFPCDVQALLASKCQTCHAEEPPGSLLTLADFTTSSTTSPELTVAEEALRRLTLDTVERMPPAPFTLSEAELGVLQAWLESGAEASGCGEFVEPGPSPYDSPVVCTSDVYWTGGADEFMHPGRACLTCHEGNEGPDVPAAGTVYPTPHEPDECHGVNDATEATVVLTGADGTEHVIPVNSAGNFLLEGTLELPYRAKVIYDGRERVMIQQQTSGDCNSCHTEAGLRGAPGRIFLP